MGGEKTEKKVLRWAGAGRVSDMMLLILEEAGDVDGKKKALKFHPSWSSHTSAHTHTTSGCSNRNNLLQGLKRQDAVEKSMMGGNFPRIVWNHKLSEKFLSISASVASVTIYPYVVLTAGIIDIWGLPLVAQRIKHLPATQESRVRFLGREDPWRRKWHPHSSVLAWRIPRTEEPGGLQSMGSQRVRHD